MRLLLILIIVTTATGSLLSALDAAGTATTEGRGQGEVDVLLRIQAHEERWDVTDLLAHTDVALADQDTSMMDGLGQS